MDNDDLRERMAALAERRGFDLSLLDGAGDSPLDPRGWISEDPAGERLEMTYRILQRESGEFDRDRLPEINPHVADWVEAQKKDPQADPMMILVGITGCGKTSQAFNAIIQLAVHAATEARSYRWRFVSHREFSAQTRGGGSMEDAVALFQSAELLVFDDLGAYNDTRYAVDCTARIIDHRYRFRLPTIYTCNLKFRRDDWVLRKEQELTQKVGSHQHVQTLQDTLDERVLSRLDSGLTVVLPAIDYRQRRGRTVGAGVG